MRFKSLSPRLSSSKALQAILLTIFLLAFNTNSAKAWDIWLVTNQRRIIIIRDADSSSPTQINLLTHDIAPHSASGDFGDIGFSPDGVLYGISMGYGSGGDAALSAIDLNNGSLSTSPNHFSFEWGNALAFDVTTGRGYAGGGLESYSPYEHFKRLRYFDSNDPGTETT